MRIHGTTRCRPNEAFVANEKGLLLRPPAAYDVPVHTQGPPGPPRRGGPGDLLGPGQPDRPDHPPGRTERGQALSQGPAHQGPSPPNARWSLDRPGRSPVGADHLALRDIDHLIRLGPGPRRGDRHLHRGGPRQPVALDQDAPGLPALGAGEEVGTREGGARPAPKRSRPRRSTSNLIARMIERATEADEQSGELPNPTWSRAASPGTPPSSPPPTRGSNERARPEHLRASSGILSRLRLGQMTDTLPERLARHSNPRCPTSTSWRWSWPTRSPAGTPRRPGCGPRPHTSIRRWWQEPGTTPPRSPSTGRCGPSSPRCGSSTTTTTH